MTTTCPRDCRVVLIGIAGPSGCGKTTYAKHLIDRLHSPLRVIELDHFFIRGVPIQHPTLGRVVSEEEPETLHTEGLFTLLRQIKGDPRRRTRYHRDDVSIKANELIFVVVEGFLLFALLDELTALLDIRIFFESTQSHCRVKRYRRECHINETLPDEQVKVSEKFQQWFDCLVWDGYLKSRDLQLSKADRVFQSRDYAEIDHYIDQSNKYNMSSVPCFNLFICRRHPGHLSDMESSIIIVSLLFMCLFICFLFTLICLNHRHSNRIGIDEPPQRNSPAPPPPYNWHAETPPPPYGLK